MRAAAPRGENHDRPRLAALARGDRRRRYTRRNLFALALSAGESAQNHSLPQILPLRRNPALSLSRRPLGDALLRLAPVAEHLGLAEGFETAWAASLLENGAPVWATLGADRFGVVTLPQTVRRVTIYADYDAPSLSNALAFFARHPELDVWIARPPIIGADFAQILELQSAASKSGALLK